LDKKKVTFLLVSDRKGVTYRWVMPSSWLKVGAIGAVVFGVIVAAAVMDYAGLLVQSVENKRLKAESIQLKDQFKIVQSKLESLEGSLTRIQTFTAKLRLITDTTEQDRALRLSMGPSNKQTLAGTEPMEETAMETSDGPHPAGVKENTRSLAAIAREDSVFMEKPPADEATGELSRQPEKEYGSLAIRIDRNLKTANLREQNVIELIEVLSNRQGLLRATPSILPASGWVSSTFGYRINPITGQATLHEGLDIAASPGTPVHAPADGVVSFAGYDPGYGKLVSIDHGFGIVTRYGHNSQLFVVAGQKIKRGDVISAVGSTGHSTGPHVHYEVRLNEVPVDPSNYILDE
jgi:murein DD-endopeptidase MepM/ murein hydrolase activator NlpD